MLTIEQNKENDILSSLEIIFYSKYECDLNSINLSVLQVLMKQIKSLITTVAMVRLQIQSLVFKIDEASR